MHIQSRLLTILCSGAVLALTGCSDSDVPPGNNSNVLLDGRAADATAQPVELADILPEEYTGTGNEAARIATAVMQPTEGNAAGGLVVFIQPALEDSRVRVVARLVDIPQGQHGFHVHENGDCTAPDASSAGEHFNPTNQPHGAREAGTRHAGDLGNIQANSAQVGELDFYDEHLTFNGVNSFVGKSFVVHAMADDLTSQPSGEAGDRIACGVITLQQG